MLKKLVNSDPATITLYKLLTVLAFILNILLVLMKEGTTRADISVIQISTLIFVAIAMFISSKQKNPERLHSWLLLTSALFIFTQSAFVYELTSPILVLNSILVVVSALLLKPLKAGLVTVLVMLGPVVGYLLINDFSFSLYLGLIMHVSALAVLFFTAAVYGRLRVDELVSSRQETVTQTTERKRLEALINSMTDGVVATDTDGVVTIYNGSALDILNVNASLENRNIVEFLNIVDQKEEPVNIISTALAQGGYLVTRDLRLVIDENDMMNLFVNISPVKVGFGSEGKEGLIMLLRDITREKSLEEERNEFISVVSHELRTPITITEGNVSNAIMVAKKDNASDLILNMLNDAHKQVVFLADMMNDLSTLSRAERGKLQIQPEDIDVHELIEGLKRDYRASAEAKGLKLLIHISKDIQPLFSSKLYVREVLQNFLTNSIKYTQSGEVKLSATMDGETFKFAVQDSGIGMSVSDQKMLFKKFFRSEDFRTRENNGTGLGLYVTMKLAKLIGATIDVQSELNKGSTFTISITSISKEELAG